MGAAVEVAVGVVLAWVAVMCLDYLLGRYLPPVAAATRERYQEATGVKREFVMAFADSLDDAARVLFAPLRPACWKKLASGYKKGGWKEAHRVYMEDDLR